MDQVNVEVLSLDEICKAALANFFIKNTLFPFKVVFTLAWIGHEISGLVDDFLELAETFTLFDLVHGLVLQYFDSVADLREEFLHKHCSTLLYNICVDIVDSVHRGFVALECLVVLDLEVFGDQRSELHGHELFLEDADVADELARAFDIAYIRLVATLAELRTDYFALIDIFLGLRHLGIILSVRLLLHLRLSH